MRSASEKLLAYIHVRRHSIAHYECPTLTKTVLCIHHITLHTPILLACTHIACIHHITCIHPCSPVCFHTSSTHLKSQTLTKKVLCVHQITSVDTCVDTCARAVPPPDMHCNCQTTLRKRAMVITHNTLTHSLTRTQHPYAPKSILKIHTHQIYSANITH